MKNVRFPSLAMCTVCCHLYSRTQFWSPDWPPDIGAHFAPSSTDLECCQMPLSVTCPCRAVARRISDFWIKCIFEKIFPLVRRLELLDLNIGIMVGPDIFSLKFSKTWMPFFCDDQVHKFSQISWDTEMKISGMTAGMAFLFYLWTAVLEMTPELLFLCDFLPPEWRTLKKISIWKKSGFHPHLFCRFHSMHCVRIWSVKNIGQIIIRLHKYWRAVHTQNNFTSPNKLILELFWHSNMKIEAVFIVQLILWFSRFDCCTFFCQNEENKAFSFAKE